MTCLIYSKALLTVCPALGIEWSVTLGKNLLGVKEMRQHYGFP